MENAQTYRKLANDCRLLASRELNIRQRVMLWMAVDAWDILAERAEDGWQRPLLLSVQTVPGCSNRASRERVDGSG